MSEYGCSVLVQLYSPGVHDRDTLVVDESHPMWGASQVASNIHDTTPMVMGKNDIADPIESYGRSAANVAAADVSGIEIHEAHSYQIGQFLSPFCNQRDDKYSGGPVERCRLALEIGTTARDQVGCETTLDFHLPFDEVVGGEGTRPEDFEEQLEVLASSGLLDFFNIKVSMQRPSVGEREQRNMEPSHLLPVLKKSGVQFVANTVVVGLDGRTAIGQETWEGASPSGPGTCDTIVLFIARVPDQTLNRSLAEVGDLSVHVVGATVAPRGVEQLTYEAEEFARAI